MYRIARADDASFKTVVSVNKRAWFDGLIELRVNRFENSLKLHWICFLLSFYATAKQCARNPWSKSSKRNVQITGNSTKLHRMFVVQILSGTKRRQASVSFVVMSTLEVVLINSEIRSITFPADNNRFINSTMPALLRFAHAELMKMEWIGRKMFQGQRNYEKTAFWIMSNYAKLQTSFDWESWIINSYCIEN